MKRNLELEDEKIQDILIGAPNKGGFGFILAGQYYDAMCEY